MVRRAGGCRQWTRHGVPLTRVGRWLRAAHAPCHRASRLSSPRLAPGQASSALNLRESFPCSRSSGERPRILTRRHPPDAGGVPEGSRRSNDRRSAVPTPIDHRGVVLPPSPPVASPTGRKPRAPPTQTPIPENPCVNLKPESHRQPQNPPQHPRRSPSRRGAIVHNTGLTPLPLTHP